MKSLVKVRKFWYSTRTSVEFNLRREFGTVGISLGRDDESGTFALQLGFASVFVSRDAWRWSVPGSLDEWEVGFRVHDGRLWVSKGRMPWAKGANDWPRSFKLPWFEWKHEAARLTTEDRGCHPYTYQWKFRPEVVQHVTAEVTEESRTWRLHLAGLALPFRKTQRSLWANFSEEMGDERGGYKGGVTGSSFALRPHESWQIGLRRMQKEATFCRGR